jgi:hypothetical protein
MVATKAFPREVPIFWLYRSLNGQKYIMRASGLGFTRYSTSPCSLTFAGRFSPMYASNEADSLFTSGLNDPICTFIHLISLFLDLPATILPQVHKPMSGQAAIKATCLTSSSCGVHTTVECCPPALMNHLLKTEGCDRSANCLWNHNQRTCLDHVSTLLA